MKKIITPLIFLFLFNFAFAQQLTYSKVLYDTLSSGIQASSVVKSFHNGYIIVGGSPFGTQKGLIMKVDTAGFYVAGNRFYHCINGTNPLISFYQTCTTLDSNYVSCGSVYDSTSNKYNGMIIKFTDNGTILWAKQYISSGASLTLTSVNQTNDSGFVICGYETISNTDHEFVAKTDGNGVLQWSEVINASGSENDEATSVIQLPDSTFMVTGCQGSSSYNSAFLTRLDKNGAVLSSKQYTANNNLSVKFSDVVLKNGNPYVLIYDENYHLFKMDVSGNMILGSGYQGGSFNAYAPYLSQYIYTRLHTSYDNGFYFMSTYGYNDMFLKVDSLGNFQHSAGSFFNIGVNAVQANDSSFFIVGNGPGVGVRMAYGSNNAPQIGIMKTDTSINVAGGGCIYSGGTFSVSNAYTTYTNSAVTSGGAIESNLPLTSQLFYFETRNGCIDITGGVATTRAPKITLYPNPASSALTLSLSANKNIISVKVFNTMGQLCNVYLDKNVLDITKLPQGIYMAEVQTQNRLMNVRFVKE